MSTDQTSTLRTAYAADGGGYYTPREVTALALLALRTAQGAPQPKP